MAVTGGGASQTQLSAANERVPSLAKPLCEELFLMEAARCLQSANCIFSQGEDAVHPTKLLFFIIIIICCGSSSIVVLLFYSRCSLKQHIWDIKSI